LLSAALTSNVRRERFVFVDAAQNVAQSRVLGLANGLQDAAVAWDEKSLMNARTPRIRTFSIF
jgi:hypothetical protein